MHNSTYQFAVNARSLSGLPLPCKCIPSCRTACKNRYMPGMNPGGCVGAGRWGPSDGPTGQGHCGAMVSRQGLRPNHQQASPGQTPSVCTPCIPEETPLYAQQWRPPCVHRLPSRREPLCMHCLPSNGDLLVCTACLAVETSLYAQPRRPPCMDKLSSSVHFLCTHSLLSNRDLCMHSLLKNRDLCKRKARIALGTSSYVQPAWQ